MVVGIADSGKYALLLLWRWGPERIPSPLGPLLRRRHRTLIGRCFLHDEVRHFRVGRIGQLTVSEEHARDQPGQRLVDFFDSQVHAEGITVWQRRQASSDP
jgi:predicted DNA-binding transcriptional regulator YafY